MIVPRQNARDAAVVTNLEVYGAGHLNEVIRFFNGKSSLEAITVNTREEFFHSQYDFEFDFNDVKGQSNIKGALEIAASGGHNAI